MALLPRPLMTIKAMQSSIILWLLPTALLCSCKRAKQEPPPPPPAQAVKAVGIPKVEIHFDLDGELSEPPWNQVAFRAVLQGDDGQQARPYSELRLLHDDKNLYIGLYAA